MNDRMKICSRWLILILIFSLLCWAPTGVSYGQSAVAEPAIESNAKQADALVAGQSLQRLTDDIRYLASDELAGRQPGQPEMLLAEKYIIEAFRDAGVAAQAATDDYRQQVPVEGQRTVKKAATRLALVGPGGLRLDQEYTETFGTLVGRKSNSVNAELVFVGYGISAPEHNYDDYQNIDVKGKVVVMIRREPQQAAESSVFDGEETSRHSFINTKVRAARRAGAVGMLLVNDNQTAPDAGHDELVQPSQFGTVSFPFYQVKRAVLNQVLATSPLFNPLGQKVDSLAKVESWIDAQLEPISQPIKGWSMDSAAAFEVPQVETSNLIGVIEGDGPLANETIIVGAHYDHLGRGAYGSRTPWRKEIHNGADDNATGTAAVLELARRFAARENKPARRLVFICFTAEEMGLLGALHYVAEPLFPIDKTAAMINFDMIGLLRDQRLTIYNWNTSPAFPAILSSVNQNDRLSLRLPAGGFAGSDHLPFNQQQIPNMFFHTGISDTYHTPDDTFETINCAGVLEVVDFSELVIDKLLEAEASPTYGKPKQFRLGVELNREGAGKGVEITKVVKGSIADSIGLREGDMVLAVGEEKIGKRRQLVRIVRRDIGKTILMKIRRGEETHEFKILLKDR